MGLSGMKFSNVLAKATGLGALALVAYDAHKYGGEESVKTFKEFKSDSLKEHLYNDMKLDSPSHVKMGVKKSLFNLHTTETISSPFVRIKGYFEGLGKVMLNNIIPLGLALVTMFGKVNGSTPFRSGISKFSALGLLAYGGYHLLNEGFGLFKDHG